MPTVKVSETTYSRMCAGLGITIPVLSEDEHGFKYINLIDEIVDACREQFGDDIDWGLNQTINENQRIGQWPKAKTSKI